VTFGEVASLCDRLGPQAGARPGERTGLLVGDPKCRCQRILIREWFAPSAEEEGLSGSMLVLRFPPWGDEPPVREDSPGAGLVRRLLVDGGAAYVVGSRLELGPLGVADQVARQIGLRNLRPLVEADSEPFFKLVVFVPRGHEEDVVVALGDAGAGHIGKYSHCTFRCPGIGTFKPLEGAQPFVGELGRLERVEEVRLETVVPESLLDQVVAAMLKVHPYEEVAYDVYPVAVTGRTRGWGRVGRLAPDVTAEELVAILEDGGWGSGWRWLPCPRGTINLVAVTDHLGTEEVRAAYVLGVEAVLALEACPAALRVALSAGIRALVCDRPDWTVGFVNPLKSELCRLLPRGGPRVE